MTCPFNKSHIMIPSRLLTHIHKCKLSSESAPLYKNCPYDPCHYFRYDQIEAHILTCDKRTLFSNEVEWESLPSPELDRTQITNGASSDTASRADQG